MYHFGNFYLKFKNYLYCYLVIKFNYPSSPWSIHSLILKAKVAARRLLNIRNVKFLISFMLKNFHWTCSYQLLEKFFVHMKQTFSLIMSFVSNKTASIIHFICFMMLLLGYWRIPILITFNCNNTFLSN